MSIFVAFRREYITVKYVTISYREDSLEQKPKLILQRLSETFFKKEPVKIWFQ